MATVLDGLDGATREQLLTVLEALQLGADRLGGAKPERKPLRSEMDRLEVRQVRPLVQRGQESVQLEVGPRRQKLWLTLDWLERWGGTFGSKSSAEANRQRGRSSSERYFQQLDAAEEPPAPERTADRGQVPAWLLYFKCPTCARRCRVLYSRRQQHAYSCPRCADMNSHLEQRRVRGNNRSLRAQHDREADKHRLAAQRIREGYLQHRGPIPGGLLTRTSVAVPKPKGMTWLRFEALCRLVEANETLSMMNSLAALQASLARIGGLGLGVPSLAEREQEQSIRRWAHTVLRLDAWALRQRSWHRKGQPRDTPGEGTRRKLARLETSEDGSGHAPQDPAS